MNDRTCIVTRERAEPDELIRFVAGPDGDVVPDLKRALPGRGCWVRGERDLVEKAVKRKLFARALGEKAVPAPDLADTVERLIERAALGALGLARKAGTVVTGATQVEKAVRGGTALLVLHARDGAADGMRKIAQARRATVHLGGPIIPAYKVFSESELSLALGGTNVIHAAVLSKDVGKAVLKRVIALDRYRGGSPDNDQAMLAAIADEDTAAEDME